MIKYEKINSDNTTLKNIGYDKTSRQLWNHVKKQAGWLKSLSPSVLNIEGKPILNSVQISEALNNFFVEKIEKITSSLPKFNLEPTFYLKNNGKIGPFQTPFHPSSFKK